MVEEVKEIKVKVYHKQTKEGKKFNSYRAVKKDGTLIDAKFRKDVKAIPTEDSMVVVKVENLNISYAKEYPVLWIKEVEEIKPIERLNNDKLNELF